MISVVIPLYNKETSIAHTLQCVLSQTYQDFEVVVVDDGSSDNGPAIVVQFTDPRIRLIRQANGGVSVARNTGIHKSRGEYIAFLDADDEWNQTHLEDLSTLIQKYPVCRAFATNYQFRKGDKLTETILNKIPFQGDYGVLSNYFEICSCSHSPVNSSVICVEKELLLSIGGFPVGIKSGEDLLTWARIALSTDIAFTKKISTIYNLGDTSVVSRRRHVEKDLVGEELKRLYLIHSDIVGFKLYLSRWFKIRSMCFLQEGQTRLVWKMAIQGLKYNPKEYKLLVFMWLSLFPQIVIDKMITKYSR